MYCGGEMKGKLMVEEEKTLAQHIAARIRSLRKQQGQTVTVVAKALGLTDETLRRLERGTERISAARLVRLAMVLGVPAATILGEPDQAEVELLAAFRQMPKRHQRHLIALAKTMVPAQH